MEIRTDVNLVKLRTYVSVKVKQEYGENNYLLLKQMGFTECISHKAHSRKVQQENYDIYNLSPTPTKQLAHNLAQLVDERINRTKSRSNKVAAKLGK